ncbi:unnamed protein product [Lasius platythorax]|uniref:Uncharacterized protein n=1 Tax=Lasius platythorax TaxID=488582 RepID=A0AAV2MZ37_9HYME
MADKTSDISEREQLLIGVRFFDEENIAIREEFLGFVKLAAMDAKTIATATFYKMKVLMQTSASDKVTMGIQLW